MTAKTLGDIVYWGISGFGIFAANSKGLNYFEFIGLMVIIIGLGFIGGCLVQHKLETTRKNKESKWKWIG